LRKPIDHALYILSTTTSFNISKIRGFSITLLQALKEGMMTANNLCEITGKYPQYVNRYLYNLRNYGMVKKNGSFWEITELGLAFLSYINKTKTYYKYDKKDIRGKYENDKKIIRKIEDQRRTIQTSFEIWLKNYHRSLHDAEKVVVEVLLDHYQKTGSKFIYCQPNVYAIAEKFGIRPDQVNQVLMNLKQDHIVYHMHDRSHNAVKIGLYKDFVKMLEFSKTMNS